MTEVKEADILDIRPYTDEEVPEALLRLLQSPVLERVRASYFSALSREEFTQLVTGSRNITQFQERIIAPLIDGVLAKSSDGLTISGFERNPETHQYVYISNHRDIICDPALFTYSLVRNGRESPLICLGDNLLSAPWIVDLVKANRGVTVKRNLSQRELLRWSHALSELVNRAVRGDQASVWIAQREGRAKDGNDQTHPGVIKMLTLTKEEPFLDQVGKLHIVPLSVSYEFDPCDALKAREVYLSKLPGGYQKQPGEDVRSMGLGIQGFKGRIHIEIGSEIREAIAKARALPSRREQVEAVVAEIDRQIHLSYRLWPANYIALDLLEGNERNRDFYTRDDQERFVERTRLQIESLKETAEARDQIRHELLQIYANPVRNSLRH